jgi:hypothetical protein
MPRSITLRTLSIDCLSGDETFMELELFPSGAIDITGSAVEGRIVVRDGHRAGMTIAIIELDQGRIERLRAFLRGEGVEGLES